MLIGVADHFLLPHCDDYLLNTGQLIQIGPGETAQPIHQDEGIWNRLSPPKHQLQVEAMFALTDFTVENGATRAARHVPGLRAGMVAYRGEHVPCGTNRPGGYYANAGAGFTRT